eukprot:739568-Hanusia_phi.AAC.1
MQQQQYETLWYFKFLGSTQCGLGISRPGLLVMFTWSEWGCGVRSRTALLSKRKDTGVGPEVGKGGKVQGTNDWKFRRWVVLVEGRGTV